MELLQLVEMNILHICPELDTIPIQDGHPVVNLLTYYCQCNSHIWAQMRSHMADKNETFKTAGVAKLIQKAADKLIFGIE